MVNKDYIVDVELKSKVFDEKWKEQQAKMEKTRKEHQAKADAINVEKLAQQIPATA